MSHTILLLAFVFAFPLYVFRFYVRENAASIANTSFLLALATTSIAGLYLALGVLNSLPPHGELGFGLTGMALLGIAIRRLFIL